MTKYSQKRRISKSTNHDSCLQSIDLTQIRFGISTIGEKNIRTGIRLAKICKKSGENNFQLNRMRRWYLNPSGEYWRKKISFG